MINVRMSFADNNANAKKGLVRTRKRWTSFAQEFHHESTTGESTKEEKPLFSCFRLSCFRDSFFCAKPAAEIRPVRPGP
jgi:hypothetical protein